jgi:acetyltransferase-like isoleucine patch superfamily enzyme
MTSRANKQFRKNIYGFLRYAPTALMEKLRLLFFQQIGVKVGKNVQFKVGSMIDVWQVGIPGEIGNNVSIGENTMISGGVKIGNNTSINSNVSIVASPPNNIIIGCDCLIAQNVVIRSDDHRFDDVNKLIREQGRAGSDITIENDCWVGANAVVLKGVHLGAHSIVGAGAIVTKSFPPYSVIVGNPAKLMKLRNNN